MISLVYNSFLFFRHRRVLNANATYLLVGGSLAQIAEGILQGLSASMLGRKKMNLMGVARANQKNHEFLGGLLDAGKIVPIIDRRRPLGETAQAIRHLVEPHARGKVVVLME